MIQNDRILGYETNEIVATYVDFLLIKQVIKNRTKTLKWVK